MIYIRTTAYNAVKTLRRTVESVLNQTYGEFKYYLCDNGSIDNGGTRKIVEEYAKLDSRIIPFYNEKNHVWDNNIKVATLPHDIDPDDFFCLLDADDEYELNFFEEMLKFIDEHDLDLAACGSAFINVADNKLLGHRILPQNLILQGHDFQDYFTTYHQFMRTIWGKLLKGKTLVNTIIDINSPEMPRAYGNDTFFTMLAFRDASRVGILSKSLHKYYLSDKSTSYNFHPERTKSDVILHEATFEFLKNYGQISPQNEKFIYLIYYNAIRDTLNVLLNAQMPSIEKMQHIREIFTCKYTQELLCGNYIDNNVVNDLRNIVLKWLLAQRECRREDGAEMAAEILMAMYEDLPQLVSRNGLKYIISKMPEMVEYLLQKDYNRIFDRIRAWFKRHDADISPMTELEISAYHASSKPDDETFTLLTSIKKSRPQASRALDIDAQICKLIEKYPLLKNMSADLTSAFPYAIRWVIKENYKQALDAFLSVHDVEISDDDAETYILFGQNLSAAAEDTGVYIYFKKVWISYLIDCSRTEEASKELDELEQLLPDDEDFIELRKKLG